MRVTFLLVLNGAVFFFSGRLVGIVRSLSKFPTYRRRYRHVVKLLIAYSVERESSGRSSASGRSASYFEITQLDV